MIFFGQTSGQSLRDKINNNSNISNRFNFENSVDQIHVTPSLFILQKLGSPNRPEKEIVFLTASGDKIKQIQTHTKTHIISETNSDRFLIGSLVEATEREASDDILERWNYKVYDKNAEIISAVPNISSKYVSLSPSGEYFYTNQGNIFVYDLVRKNNITVNVEFENYFSMVLGDSLFILGNKVILQTDSVGLKNLNTEYEKSFNQRRKELSELRTKLANNYNQNNYLLELRIDSLTNELKRMSLEFRRDRSQFYTREVEDLSLVIFDLVNGVVSRSISLENQVNDMYWFSNYEMGNKKNTEIEDLHGRFGVQFSISRENNRSLNKDAEKVLVFNKDGDLIFESEEFSNIIDFKFPNPGQVLVLSNNSNQRSITLYNLIENNKLWQNNSIPRLGNLDVLAEIDDELIIQQKGISLKRTDYFKTVSVEKNHGKLVFQKAGIEDGILISKSHTRRIFLNHRDNKLEVYKNLR